MLTRAKSALTRAIAGFAIIFLAWLVINTAMNVMGWNKGNWHEVACDGGISSFTFSCCGDGKVDKPNDCGCTELCEKDESLTDFLARCQPNDPDTDLDDNGVCEELDHVLMQSSCTSFCTFGCREYIDELGLGCWFDVPRGHSDYCKRGRVECDEATDTIICLDTFDPPIYDECCVNGGAALPSMDFDIIYFSSGTFNCDDVCRKYGKVCVGVGLMDSDRHYCKSVKHHESPSTTCDDGTRGKDCTNAINITGNDCRSTFVAGRSDCVNCYDVDGDGSTEPYWFQVASPPSGGTACYCANR
jgi:hypothetical protein